MAPAMAGERASRHHQSAPELLSTLDDQTFMSRAASPALKSTLDEHTFMSRAASPARMRGSPSMTHGGRRKECVALSRGSKIV